MIFNLQNNAVHKVKNFTSAEFPAMNFSFLDLSKAESEIAGLK